MSVINIAIFIHFVNIDGEFYDFYYAYCIYFARFFIIFIIFAHFTKIAYATFHTLYAIFDFFPQVSIYYLSLILPVPKDNQKCAY